MSKTKDSEQRFSAAKGVVDIDVNWAEIFSETLFSDLNFCDLLVQMWIHRDEPLRKMDLYKFMPNVSQRTAVKHIQVVIEKGGLLELPCAEDRRARLVVMSKETQAMVEQWLDFVHQRFLLNYCIQQGSP